MDFSQYIADNDDNAGSMNSISSPSLGMMSKTPFKTPVPSEYADEAIELDSSPAGRPIKLRDHLPGLGSSVEPSFAVDDSQQTKVIAKAADVPKAPPNPPARFSYSLSVSPDNARDAPINTNGSQLPAIDSGSPGAEEAAPAKGKTWQVKKAELPKRSTRNRKINGKKRPEAKQDDAAAVGNATEAAPAREIPPAKKMESSKETAPLKEAKPSKRPLLARMLSVLSEPESLKWEDPLVGGRQSPVDGDGCPPAQSPRSPGGTPTAQEDTAMLPVDDDGSIYEPSIPASFAEPFEFEALERERVPDSPPAGPKAKGTQAFPTFRLDPDAIGPNPQNDSPPKSPMKGARKGSSLEKRARGPQKTTVSSKRRRVQNPVKKRVVQPRSRAKSVRYHKDVEDELETPVTGPHEPQPTVTTDAPHTNSKSRVSETGRPTNVTVSSESASSDEGRINEMANSEDMEENEKAVGSPNRRASPTETSELEVVFKSQSSRPHTMTAQAGSPRPRGQRMAAKSPEAGLKALITPKSLSKPSCAGAKKSAEKNAPRDAPSQAQPGPSAQQNPAFEVFRQHILGQLTSIEAKQQQDRSSQNDDPNNTQAIAEKRSPVNIVPQHMLGNVLHSLMEVS